MTDPGQPEGGAPLVSAAGERLHVAALLERGLQLFGRLVGYESALVERLTGGGTVLHAVAGTGGFRGFLGRRLPRGQGFGWKVLEAGRVLHEDCSESKAEECSVLAVQEVEVLGLPIPGETGPLGVLLAARPRHEGAGDQPELPEEDLQALAGLAGRLLDRDLLLRQLVAEVEERREAEAAVRESEARLRAIVEGAGDAIFIRDHEGRYLLVNPAAAEHLGLSVSRMLGRRPQELVPPEDAARMEETDQEVLSSGEAVEYEVVLEQNGKRRVFHSRKWPFRSPAGEVIGVVGISREVTELKQAEEERRRLEGQIQHAQKLESLGVLAGGIAHDFNNLLVSILGNAGLVLMDLPAESPARFLIKQIESAARRASDLTNQMLAYSGRGRFVVERVNLSRLVQEMEHLLRVAVPVGVSIQQDLAEELPPVDGDPGQLRQVVMNLITNAGDAIGEQSGVVTVATGVQHVDRSYMGGTVLAEELQEGDYVFLEVTDTGCGMDADTRERIFDPFFTTKFTGRGLGLAAVLGIVRGHRGAIKVYSEPGKGSTFKILLPVSRTAAEEPTLPRDVLAEWKQHSTILVVDDEESVRAVAKMTLERAGFEVLTARDGREAVELVRERGAEIDLVLLDMTMPRMNGEEAFRHLRGLRPDICVVLSSGYSEQEATRRFAGKGLAGFIQKPWSPKELLGEVQSILEKRSV